MRTLFCWRWLVPALVGATLIGGVVGADRYVHQRLDRSMEAEAQRLAERQALHLEDYLDARLEALEQMRIDIEDGSVQPGDRRAFEPRARLLQASLHGYQAINWIDADGLFRIVVPEAGNRRLLGLRATERSNRARSALDRARATGELELSRPKELRQGGLGVVAYLPVRVDGEIVGYLNAAFRVDELIRGALRTDSDEEFGIQVWDGPDLLFASNMDDALTEHVEPQVAVATVADRAWTVSVTPTRSHHAGMSELEHPGYLLVLAFVASLAAALWIAVRRTRERSAARRRLRLLERVVQQARDYVSICDTNGRLLYVNQAGRQMLGFEDGDVTTLTVADLHASGDEEEVEAIWRSLRETGSWRGRGLLANLDGGEPVPADFVISAIRDDAGEAVAYASFGRDRRSEEHLEAQLRQAQKMEAVGQLAGGIAHDFNNLMTVVRNNADLLAERLDRDAEAMEELLPILTAADNATALTRRLLSLGRRSSVARVVVDFGRVVEDMSPLLRVLTRENVEVCLDLDPDAPSIECAPSDVEQVLINLVVNASQAMPDGGRIDVSTRASDGGLLLRVADRGPGIPAEIRERMFEPFFTTKAPGEGSGLGLATVYGIVTSNGGRVRVDSEIGQGTAFEIWWPATSRPARVSERPEPRRPSDEPLAQIVLVVEDEPLVRRTARRLLHRSGYEVLEAGNAEEALGVLDRESGRIDLVLSDMVMPGMSGRELLRRVRARGLWTPFVLASGYHEEGLDAATLRSLHAVFLDKPYDRSGLCEAADRALAFGAPGTKVA